MSRSVRGAVTSVVVVMAVAAGLPAADAAAARARLTLTASATSVATGTPVTLAGRARGQHRPQARVAVQQATDHGWRTLVRLRLREHGYRTQVVAAAGTATYRAKIVRDRGVATRVLPTVQVTGTSSPGGTTTRLDQVRALILQQTNAFRAQQGLAPLQPMAALDAVAQPWTERMAATDDLVHNPDYAGQYPSGWTRAAENIAYGYAAEQVVQGWIDSPGHRANLLGAYTHLGIGYALAADGRAYFAQDFAAY